MSKDALSGFMLLMGVVAIGLYLYGKNTLFNLSTPTEKEYVESKINPYGWVDYQSDSLDYQIKFPNSPQRAIDQSTDITTKSSKKYEMLVSEKSGKAFMLSVVTFDNNRFMEKRLDDTVKDMAKANPENQIKSLTHGLHNYFKDADFVITNPNYTILGRGIIDNNKIYILTSVGANAKEMNAEFNFFIQSFKINESNQGISNEEF